MVSRTLKSGLLDGATEGPERKQAGVSEIQNAALAVVNLPDHEHEALTKKADIGGADHHFDSWVHTQNVAAILRQKLSGRARCSTTSSINT